MRAKYSKPPLQSVEIQTMKPGQQFVCPLWRDRCTCPHIYVYCHLSFPRLCHLDPSCQSRMAWVSLVIAPGPMHVLYTLASLSWHKIVVRRQLNWALEVYCGEISCVGFTDCIVWLSSDYKWSSHIHCTRRQGSADAWNGCLNSELDCQSQVEVPFGFSEMKMIWNTIWR